MTCMFCNCSDLLWGASEIIVDLMEKVPHLRLARATEESGSFGGSVGLCEARI